MDTLIGYLAVMVFLITADPVGSNECQGVKLLTKGETYVQQTGQDITLPCKVSEKNFNVLFNTIVLKKDGHPVNSMANVQEPFRSTGRYKLEIPAQDKMYEYYFKINGLTAADHGNFTCEVSSCGDRLKATYRLIIAEPVEEVRLTSDNTENLSEPKIFKFTADQPSNVTCDVKGGRPNPKVRIMLDDTEDITSQFETKTTPTQEIGEGEGLEVISYQTKVSGEYTPGTKNNLKTLKCVARLDITEKQENRLGMEGVTMDDSAKIEQKFAPEIDCEDDFSADLNEEFVELSCKIRASPMIDLSTLVWSFGPENNRTNMTDKMMDPDQRYETYTTEDKEKGVVTTTLRINKVDEEDFQVYELDVSNSLGADNHEINFHKKEATKKPKVTPAGAVEENLGNVRDGSSRVNGITVLSLVISLIAAVCLL